jgi:hypothetical protein
MHMGEGDGGAKGEGDGGAKLSDGSAPAAAPSIWESIKEATQKVGKWAHDFVSNLQDAPLETSTKKKISDVCRSYQHLMENTSVELQSLRGECLLHVLYPRCNA